LLIVIEDIFGVNFKDTLFFEQRFGGQVVVGGSARACIAQRLVKGFGVQGYFYVQAGGEIQLGVFIAIFQIVVAGCKPKQIERKIALMRDFS